MQYAKWFSHTLVGFKCMVAFTSYYIYTDGAHGSNTFKSLQNTLYMELSYGRIYSICTSLSNYQEEPVKFTSGIVVT